MGKFGGREREGVQGAGCTASLALTVALTQRCPLPECSEAAICIAEGLIANNVLEELVLNGNAVGDDGARHLMNALKSNSSLQYLGLQV